ncbi:MAG: N-acetylmuramoyl-L-alanine amidase [Oscillospiraceae bacterium]|nr:N-acetylmuramoyl-L-alanine amidase [Oscillospiraceae bacterium]
MSNSNLVNYTRISPNSSQRDQKIDKITIHHMAGNLTVEQCGELFYRPSTQASSNYGIGSDGRVGLYVDESRRAWTSSNRENDLRAVTIEVANDGAAPDWHVSDKALAKLIDLCVDICRRNGIAALNYTGDANGNLTRHNMFAATACPGPYLQGKFPEIVRQVNARLGNPYTLEQFVREVQAALGAGVDGIAGPETFGKTITVSSVKNAYHPVVKAIQKRLYAMGYTVVGPADGTAGPLFTRAVLALQKDKGAVSDGEITARNLTWRILLGMTGG